MSTPSPHSHIALLRGINVGGRHKLPMQRLVSIFEEAGCESVTTYIQSGNVVFTVEPELAGKIPAVVRASISRQFGFDVPITTRSAAELQRIVRANPFVGTEADLRTLHVAFLAERPTAARIATLDPERSSPDEFVVEGREIYLRCPNGMARTKLTNAYFDSKLATTSTVRNWKTTLELVKLATGIG